MVYLSRDFFCHNLECSTPPPSRFIISLPFAPTLLSLLCPPPTSSLTFPSCPSLFLPPAFPSPSYATPLSLIRSSPTVSLFFSSSRLPLFASKQTGPFTVKPFLPFIFFLLDFFFFGLLCSCCLVCFSFFFFLERLRMKVITSHICLPPCFVPNFGNSSFEAGVRWALSALCDPESTIVFACFSFLDIFPSAADLSALPRLVFESLARSLSHSLS